MENWREELNTILEGIDEEETHNEKGWWETSLGAEFGREVKVLIIKLIEQELDKAREEEYKKLIEIFSNLKKEDLVNKGFILSLIKEELSKVEKYPQKAVYLSAEEVERREKLSKLKDNK